MARFLVLFIVLSTGNVYGLIKFEDAAFPELATSARALAMGNAFISKVDNHHAAFYNPAGLGSARGVDFHLFNVHLESNDDLNDMAGGSSIDGAGSNASKAMSINGVRQLLIENRGKVAHSRVNSIPHITTRFFSMGYLYSKQTRATIGREENAKYEYAIRQDYGPWAAVNISLFGGIIKMGYSGVYVSRKEKIDESPRDESIDLHDEDFKKGNVFLGTAGGKLTLPIAMLPTFSYVIRNTADNEFHAARGQGQPDQIKQTQDMGISITPLVGKTVRFHIEAAIRDTDKAYGVSSARRGQAGFELDIARTMFVRGGFGDGWGCGGIGVKTRRVALDLTTYAVDTTSNEYRKREDRRFVFSLSTGF